MYIFCEISDINKCSQKVTSSDSTLPTPDNAVALQGVVDQKCVAMCEQGYLERTLNAGGNNGKLEPFSRVFRENCGNFYPFPAYFSCNFKNYP